MYVLKVILLAHILTILSCKKESAKESLKPPVITSFSPMEGPPGTLVVIEGSNFVDVKSVYFNNQRAYHSLNGSKLEVIVPANAVDGMLSVQTSAGSANSSASFKVLPSLKGPVITNLLPNNNPPEWPVLIEGENIEDIISIKFGDIPVTVIDTNFQGVVTTRVPKALAPGKTTITVTNKAGVSNKLQFTVLQQAPPDLTPPMAIMFRKKARYSPVVSDNWRNEFGEGGMQMGENSGSFDDGLGNYYPMLVSSNAAQKTITVKVFRYADFDQYDTYLGEYVEADSDKRQRIIFMSPWGRQVVVGVNIP